MYSEFGKILPREVQDNLDEWEEKVEPLLGLTREHAALCATVLQQLALGVFALAIRRGALSIALRMQRAPRIRDRPGSSGCVAGCRLLQPDPSIAAFHAHQGPLGSAAGLADSPAAVADDAGHGYYPLLLFRGGAG